MPKYAYSYDREDYTGSFDTPEEALTEAVRRSEGLASPPGEVFIGQIVEADPQAHDHAERILDAMNQRAYVDYGEPARRYLARVPKELVKELDEAIGATILDWLKRHNLMPTFVQVRGIRALPVPTPAMAKRGQADPTEVHDLGISMMPDGMP